MTSFQFGAGAYNHALGTRDAFGRLSDRLVSEGHAPMRSVSGDRERAEQVATFVARYRQQATGTGPYGDVRWWNGDADGYPGGDRWVRHSSAGTVAVPGSSNHEKRRSNDLAWPYNTTATAAHARAHALAPDYGITCEGLSFSEAWHWTFWGTLGVIGAPASGDASTFDPATILEASMSNPIVNVVPDYKAPKQNGTLWIGKNNGEFERYVPTPSEPNVRGVISVVFYGGGGDEDLAPTINARDFQTVKSLWKTMCGAAS